MDLEYSWFKKKIFEIVGLNIDGYRPDQMKRLVDKMVDKSGARNYVEYIKRLERSPAGIQEFRDSVTINVSSLFRDSGRWMELNSILSKLIAEKTSLGGDNNKTGSGSNQELRAWSAGCSIGAEPYTLAILLEELIASPSGPPFSYRLLCTDIDHNMLHRARSGVFTDKETGEVAKRLMKKYFREIERPDLEWAQSSAASRFYEAIPNLRRNLNFRIHNLLSERWETGFDLIICRNVLIYFTNDIKDRLFERFFDALVPDGILFIGGTETISTPCKFGLENAGTGIYKKAEPGKVI